MMEKIPPEMEIRKNPALLPLGLRISPTCPKTGTSYRRLLMTTLGISVSDVVTHPTRGGIVVPTLTAPPS
jgi:hypothetical protein